MLTMTSGHSDEVSKELDHAIRSGEAVLYR